MNFDQTSYISRRLAEKYPPGRRVTGALTWQDTNGQWWMAPLGSPAPIEDDAAPPLPWLPITFHPRPEQLPDGVKHD